MDNLDKLHAEQDEFIRNVFSEDKIVSQPVLKDFTTYIENSNIKAKKYSHKQVRLIFILLLLLIISVGTNIYFAISKNKPIENSLEDSKISNTLETNTLDDIKKSENKTNTANTSDVEISNTVTNTSIPTATVTPKDEESDLSDINLDEIRSLVESYSVGINRISSDTNNLESNTILLFIAKDYFDNKPSKSSLKIDAIYAATAENIHKYLTELTGNDYSNIEYIPSFNNYIGYTRSSKSYTLGPNSSTITKEKYTCSNVEIKEKINDIYTIKADVTRTVDDVETNYELELQLKINSNYTYQKYNVKSLKAKNTSFYPDNTVRLIDQNDMPIEEDGKKG